MVASKDRKYSDSVDYHPFGAKKDSERINKIHEYMLAHFKEHIYLDQIARHANVSANLFCRYFKSHIGKTYNIFLQEFRMGHARRLLIENK